MEKFTFKLSKNGKRINERKNKSINQLNESDQQPKIQAEKKGTNTEGLRISEKEKIENEKIIEETDKKINLFKN